MTSPRYTAKGKLKVFLDRFNRDQSAFFARVGDPARRFEIVQGKGFAVAGRLIAELGAGGVIRGGGMWCGRG